MARDNGAPFLANVAMAAPMQLGRHQDLRHDGVNLGNSVGMIGLVEDVREMFLAARRGEIPKRFAFSVTPLSNIDSTQAPPGQSIAYLYVAAIAVRMNKGQWDQALKDRVMTTILEQCRDHYTGFDAEIGRFVESPMDRQARLNISNGCVTHIDFAASRSGLKRPAYGLGGPKPVAPGFFLGGAAIHPGGGVTGLPGKISADRVIRHLR